MVLICLLKILEGLWTGRHFAWYSIARINVLIFLLGVDRGCLYHGATGWHRGGGGVYWIWKNLSQHQHSNNLKAVKDFCPYNTRRLLLVSVDWCFPDFWGLKLSQTQFILLSKSMNMSKNDPILTDTGNHLPCFHGVHFALHASWLEETQGSDYAETHQGVPLWRWVILLPLCIMSDWIDPLTPGAKTQ